MASPALGDIDGDGHLDIVVGATDGKLYAWHADGRLVAGWPRQTGNWILSSPVLGAIDGDPGIDVVVGSSDGLYIWRSTPLLPPASGFEIKPLHLTAAQQLLSSPALGDLDQDKDTEIVVSSLDAKVYVWDVNGTFDARYVPWGMFKGNPRRTGRVGDYDGDGLSNFEELELFETDPLSSDPDRDGLSDKQEIYNYLTNPWVADGKLDTDGDGLTNVDEVRNYRTDPRVPDATADTDGDQLLNIDEVNLYGTDPTSRDTDEDGLNDDDEIRYGTDPHDPDSDDDGITDWQEIYSRQDPLSADFPDRIRFGTFVLLGFVLLLLLLLLAVIYVFLEFTTEEIRWRKWRKSRRQPKEIQAFQLQAAPGKAATPKSAPLPQRLKELRKFLMKWIRSKQYSKKRSE